MKNTSELEYCFGCGVCALACPKKIISIELNSDGFYQPYIKDNDKCIECGLCLKVCAFTHEELSQSKIKPKSYAAWSSDKAVRKKCSSGGAGFEIGRYMLDNGGQVLGVKYNIEKERAEHFVVSTLEDLVQTTGSKYIQSYAYEGFKEINLNKKYLVTGTPCQIDSFRRFLKLKHKEDNFILMDFFCHGVPSLLAWNLYCKMVSHKVGNLSYVEWRNKTYGWHDSWNMCMEGDNYNKEYLGKEHFDSLIKEKKCSYQSRLSKGDTFYKLFLGDFCMNKACSKECKYKYDSSAADLRIGDLWGSTYAKNEEGVSALVGFSNKGINLISQLSNYCVLKEHPFEIVAEGQMKKNCGKAYLSPVVWHFLKSNKKPLNPLFWKFIFKSEGVLKLPKRILQKIKR